MWYHLIAEADEGQQRWKPVGDDLHDNLLELEGNGV